MNAKDMSRRVKQCERDLYLRAADVFNDELNKLHEETGLDINEVSLSLTHTQCLSSEIKRYDVYDIDVSVSLPESLT